MLKSWHQSTGFLICMKKGLKDLTKKFLKMKLDKSLARSKWSANILSRPCIICAALDAWISLVLCKKTKELVAVHKKITRKDLESEEVKTGTLVKLLLPKHTATIGHGKIVSMKLGLTETIGPKKTKCQHDEVMVEPLSIVDPSANIPSPLWHPEKKDAADL